MTFAVSAVATGVQALVDPIGFTKTFGLLLSHNIKADDGAASTASRDRSVTLSYVSLMGVRQLATGLTLLVFAWQSKWTEAATILAIIGVVVAGTDGVYLARGGEASKGRSEEHTSELQ